MYKSVRVGLTKMGGEGTGREGKGNDKKTNKQTKKHDLMDIVDTK